MHISGGKLALAVGTALAIAAPAAHATPVCTDGYKGGPPLALCGGRIFPEADNALSYVQYSPLPNGLREYQDGIDFLEQSYPGYVDITTLAERFGPNAVSAGPDKKRAGEPGDSSDGRQIPVIKITDESVPDAGKRVLFFSLSIHGNERGGLEGGLRTAEDLVVGATKGNAYLPDGMPNYTSTTGRTPTFHAYNLRELLKKEILYLVDVNIDGWAVGDIFASPTTNTFSRGNSIGTDLNRQMPTLGSIDTSRNPLQEAETRYGKRFIDEVAAQGPAGELDYGADVHGELTSQAYTDIMYPAGEFDSVDHRRLMDIAERTKSVVDATLYAGIQDQIEEATGGNEPEGPGKDTTTGTGLVAIPTKPAHWATVWDTLGYTDTGFLGDYLAGDVGVLGMDYEIFLNHTVPEKTWDVYLQENHINATRAIIKTAMAYALTEDTVFSDDNVRIPTGGRPGYVVNPAVVTDADGAGTRPGPNRNGIGADGKPVVQAHYSATNMQWFRDTSRLLTTPFVPLASGDVADRLDLVDSLVLADQAAPPKDTQGRAVDAAAYYAALKAWVAKGGNLVLTDRSLHALEAMGVVPKGAVKDVKVYQPYANFTDLGHPMLAGLRSNARQLVEAAILGYGIGDAASPMSVVDSGAWTTAGGVTTGTTGDGAGTSDDKTRVSVGELKLGAGVVRILGGALPTPTEANDHRFGLRDYAPTYTGLFILENSLRHDAPGLGEAPLPASVAKAQRRQAKLAAVKR
jgi:hypothetical protein